MPIKVIFMLTISAILVSCQTIHIPEATLSDAFTGKDGTIVIIDCSSGTMSNFRPNESTEPLAPCSTFKIWNTLIGLENGLIHSPEEIFYKWDGITREMPEWNEDLTLIKAFQVSCVPAFQDLARKIGAQRMQLWIDKINYGNRDISAGIDVFWLPAPGRTTLLITPEQQAWLMYKLITGKLPFSEKSRIVLKDIMKAKETDHGTLYGKTGSGTYNNSSSSLGWYVGYVESKGRAYAFACTVKGSNLMGKDARSIVETIFTKKGFL